MMMDEFGPGRAATLSKDHVFSGLGGHTVEQALTAGVPTKEIWQAVCAEFEVLAERR
jgi:hypothetical protein